MSITISCPHCGQNLKVQESQSGTQVTCPNCRNPMTVPEDVFEAETYGASATSSPADSRSSSRSSSRDNDRRPCPMCGEMISTEAAKCRFCGEIFDAELRRMEKKKQIPSGDADMSVSEWVIAILCSGIGCIAGIIWMIQGKPKGPKMFGVSLLFAVLWSVIRAALESAVKH